MKKLKVLPPMACDSDCGACCGYAPATTTEFHRIVRYAKDNKIIPMNQGAACPFYQGGICAVYPVRQLSCRLFGHVKGMACQRGYNVNIDDRQALRMARSNGRATHLVHHALEEMGVAKVILPKMIQAMLDSGG